MSGSAVLNWRRLRKGVKEGYVPNSQPGAGRIPHRRIVAKGLVKMYMVTMALVTPLAPRNGVESAVCSSYASQGT